ncbi:MAG: phosphatidylserine decarboxylase [Acidobacteriota bacterium]
MAKDAYYFLIPVAALAVLFFLLNIYIFGAAFVLLAGFVAFFFRDPEREIPKDPSAIVSPADGRIISVETSQSGTRLSIFLSVLDVHINRAPIAGVVLEKNYRPGKFVVAYDSRASVENEQVVMTIGQDQRQLTFALIAGIVARRIRVWKNQGESVNTGDRIGLIRFGSRVDVFLPPEVQLLVRKGDRVYGGTSIIAQWRDS